MEKILAIFILNLLTKEGSCGVNTCPKIIQFNSDGDKRYGVITIPPSVKSGLNSLEVKVELRGNITGGENELKLVKPTDELVADIKRGYDIQFKFDFLQSSLSPNIIKITVNNKDFCNGIAGFGGHTFDIPYHFVLPSLSTPTPSTTSQLLSANTSSVQPHDAAWLQSLPFSGICGRSFQLTHTIIGGAEVAPGEYPWMVALYHYKPEQKDSLKFVCGASLISDMYVITAATCTQKQTQVHLEFGKYNIGKDFETNSVSRISWKIISHPEYKKATHGDIAIVSFHPPVTFTQWIVPICLWGNFDSKLHQGIVAGWGQQNNHDFSPSAMPNQLSMSMMELQICRDSHIAFQNLATEKIFCAGGNSSGPCHGDSGGGFFITHKNVWYLRGVISYVVGTAWTCDVDEYSVYVDLAYALDWIRPYLTTGKMA